jgi:hypothetical protein
VTCDRIQSELSRAWDEGRDPAAFEEHLGSCASCAEFASGSLIFADRYRTRVLRGVDRLRRTAPAFEARRSASRWLLPLAAAVLILLSFPLRPAPAPVPCGAPSARVPLFDAVHFPQEDLQPLVWSGEPPLPRRIAQDLPRSLAVDLEPGLALPATLRF